MKNLTKIVMLGLLLIPFAAVIELDNAYAATFDIEIEAGSANAASTEWFEPAEARVAVGTTVVWTNKDAAGHTITSGNPGDADAGALFDSTKDPAGFLIKPEAKWQHMFDKAGTFPYFCQVHPWMVAKLIIGGAAPPPPPRPENALVMTTDNGSIDVEVTIDKGMVHDSQVMIDPPQQVKFDIKFLDPKTGQPLQHVNYQFHVADKSGAMVAHKMGIHVHEGMDSQSVSFSNTGSFTLMIVVEGTGINKPYDTAHSGTANSMIAVTPEFPLSVMAIMAAVVGVGVAATRFKNPLKL